MIETAKMTRRDRFAARQSGQAVLMAVMAVLLVSISAVSAFRYVGPKASLQSQSQVSHMTGLAAPTASGSMARVHRALLSFVGRNYRLPCPADGSIATGGVNDGVENCALANAGHGVVPWKTLGLTYTDSLDGFQHRIGYAASSALDASGSTPFKTAPAVSLNAIPVSINGANAVCPGGVNCFAYALISYGADGAGGWLQSGKQQAVPANTLVEYPNTLTSAFAGNGAVSVGTACSAATTTFQVCPAYTASLTAAKYFDDTLIYETAQQICTDVNGSLTSQNWVLCGNGGNPKPPASYSFTGSLLTGANGGTLNGGGCSSSYCPGSTNAGSLANTYAFVGGNGSGSLTSPTSLSMVGGVGTVSVTGGAGVQVGNNSLGLNGDWIGANNGDGACGACFGSGWTPNYTIPNQAIIYNLTNTYNSFAFAAYLVDGGMQIQVDGYLSDNIAITGNVLNNSSTVTGVSTTTNINVGESAEGSATYSSLLPGGTTITGIVASSTNAPQAQITFSSPINLTTATNTFFALTPGTSATSFVGDVTAESNSITSLSSTAGLSVGAVLAGNGVVGSKITAIDSVNSAISVTPAASYTETGDPIFEIVSSASISGFTGTVSTSAPLSITGLLSSAMAGLTAGQTIVGLGVQSGTTITYVDTVHDGLSVSKAMTPALSGGTINVIANSYSITGSTSVGLSTVTNVSSESGLVVGMNVTGPGIPSGAYIVSLPNSTTLELSDNATRTATGVSLFVAPWTKVGTVVLSNGPVGTVTNGISFTGDLTASSTTIANVLSAANLAQFGVGPGSPVAGYGIPAGTTIASIGSNTITLSQAAVATVTTQSLVVQPASLVVTPTYGTLTAGSKAVPVSSGVGLAADQSIAGVGISSGVSITAASSTGLSLFSSATLSENTDPLFVNARSTTTVTGTVSGGTKVLTNLSSVSGLATGEFITGYGIQPGTLITSVSTALSTSTNLSVTLSQTAVLSQTDTTFYAGYTPPLTAAAITGTVVGSSNQIGGLASTALPGVGETIYAANFPPTSAAPGTATIVSAVSGTTLTLSQSASASLSSAATLYPTYAPCPGPATKIGTTTPNGIYAAPVAINSSNSTGSGNQGDYAPTPQHSMTASAAIIPSQIWPQPGTPSTGLGSASSNPNQLQGNYIDQRDNQFYNRMFTDSYGTPQKFNILMFQVLPYVYSSVPTTLSNANTTCAKDSLGRLVCQYGMLFEGAEACPLDTYSTSCTMFGNDEWWNPPVAETMDCGQNPS